MSEDLDALWDKAQPVAKPAEDLDALWEKAVPGAVATPRLSAAQSLGLSAGRKVPFASEGAAALKALQMKLQGSPVDFGENYRQLLLQGNRVDKQAQEDHPVAHGVGSGLGIAATAAALPGVKLPVGGMVGRLGSGVLTGGAYNLAADAPRLLGQAAGGDVSGAVKQVGADAMQGGAGGLAGGVVGEGIGLAAKPIVRGLAKVTDAAKLLRSKGVTLTLGQMNPGGLMSKLEEAGQHSAMGGHAISDAREAAREGWQNAVLNEGRPIPGQLRPGTVQDKLAGVYQDFKPAYAAAGDAPVLAGAAGKGHGGLVALRTAFNNAAEDPGTYATEADVNAVKRFLGNQVSLVERAMESKGAEPLKASALLEMRSNIRAAIRDAASRQDGTAAKLLGNAEEALTGSLEKQLPPSALQALRDADSHYGTYRVLEDAVRRGGDQPNGFTPAQLSQAVRGGTQRGAYARGAGGQLRELAQAGREVLDARQPATGAKLLTLPLGLNHAAGPIAALANRPSAQAFLLGETGLQRALQGRTGAPALGGLGGLSFEGLLSPGRGLPAQPQFAQDDALEQQKALATALRRSP